MLNTYNSGSGLAKIKASPYLAVMLSALALTACDGGSSSSSSSDGVSAGQQQETGNGDVQDDLDGTGTGAGSVIGVVDGSDDANAPGGGSGGGLGAEQGEADRSEPVLGLIVGSVDRCSIIFEPIQLVVTQQLPEGAEVGSELPNVSSLVSVELDVGSPLNLVSLTDDGINFEISEQDIARVTASFDAGSVTTFLAGYDRANPDSFIMRKPVNGGCRYAFKSEDFCTTGFTTTGVFAASRNGSSMSAVGCELSNPDDLPVIELSAE